MPVTVDAAQAIVLPPKDMARLRALQSFINAHPGAWSLSTADGSAESVVLCDEISSVLRVAVGMLVEQIGVALSGVTTRLTTTEAAALLGISRPTLVRLLDEGQISYERPRKHRLVLLEDVLRYQARMRTTAATG
jgi:excisionase family DNA binding protein